MERTTQEEKDTTLPELDFNRHFRKFRRSETHQNGGNHQIYQEENSSIDSLKKSIEENTSNLQSQLGSSNKHEQSDPLSKALEGLKNYTI